MRLRTGSLRFVRSGLFLLLALLLATGACAGIIFWAWRGSLIGVALSALVPGSWAIALATSEAWRIRPSSE